MLKYWLIIYGLRTVVLLDSNNYMCQSLALTWILLHCCYLFGKPCYMLTCLIGRIIWVIRQWGHMCAVAFTYVHMIIDWWCFRWLLMVRWLTIYQRQVWNLFFSKKNRTYRWITLIRGGCITCKCTSMMYSCNLWCLWVPFGHSMSLSDMMQSWAAFLTFALVYFLLIMCLCMLLQ